MAKKKYSVSSIKDIVDSEGLGYAVQHGLDSGSILDDELSDMWERAENVLAEIADYLEENGDNVSEYEESVPPEEQED